MRLGQSQMAAHLSCATPCVVGKSDQQRKRRLLSQPCGPAQLEVGVGAHAPTPGNSSPKKPLTPAVAALLQNVQRHGSLLQQCCVNLRPLWQMDPAAFGSPKATSGSSGDMQPEPGMPHGTASNAAEQTEPREGEGSGLGTLADYLITTQARGGRIQWRPEDLKIMLNHLTSLTPGSSSVETKQAMKKLGIAHLPDPSWKLHTAVVSKLRTLRNMLAHGWNPLGGLTLPRAPRGTYNFRAWLRHALLTLPNREGTLLEAAAVLEADPDIAPKLDRRPDRRFHDTPMWHRNLRFAATSHPEFVDIARRGKAAVYRYDEEVARQQDAHTKPPKVPKRRVPHLGVHGGGN
ncbi:hypothetical protein Agub_g7491 [Astrephomene gubernaculifera]|uniref:Uncharacterized protein n=1 Tax=Astrephomene gubernaculifera TaxID=47775 RepID=A0AAD3HMB4_9CHLO|nr:hypothetical protein Agub_g7491 [Astrephomene gubernaculifera]